MNEQHQAETSTERTADADTAATADDELRTFISAGGTFGLAIRDLLAQAQLSGTGAAQMSGEHLANLLYPSDEVARHTAPYSGRNYLNPRDFQLDERR